MSPRSIVIWQPALTTQQSYLFEALGKLAGLPVVACVEAMGESVRREQGWPDLEATTIERMVIPARGKVRYLRDQLRSRRGDIHIFSGVFASRLLTSAFAYAAFSGVNCYLMSEPYGPKPVGYFSDDNEMASRVKQMLRPLIYRLYAGIVRRSNGVFAISRRAMDQYESAGVPGEKIFPFGYFVPRTTAPRIPAATNPAEPLRVAFVGSLIRRKGLDILIEAVRKATARGARLRLDVYGPGEPQGYDMDGTTVAYRGRVPYGDGEAVIAGHDLFVLPSRYDGWGVVVNEAMFASVPAVCSDHVGATVLLETFGSGAVFPDEDVDALAGLLVRLAGDRSMLHQLAQGTAAAAAAIEPDVAARYVLDVMQAQPAARSRIEAPWYRSSKSTV